MSFDTVSGVLAAALAPAGTLTLAYPTGRSKGDYVGAAGHKVVFGGNNELSAPTAFTLTFNANASGITYTHGTGQSTVPAGTRYTVQIGRAGVDDKDALPATIPARMVPVSAFRIDLGAPSAAVSNGVAASQSVAAGAAFSLNGSLLSAIASGQMIFDVPRNVVAAWTTTSILTITGKDEFGKAMVEVSASGTSHTGKKAFKEITRITSSASITGATVGTGNVFGLPVFLPRVEHILAEMEDGFRVSPATNVFLPWELEATELAAGTAENLVSPVAGYIQRIRGVTQEAIGTGGVITAEINTVAVTGLSITVANSDAAGTRYSDTPTTPRSATTLLAAGDRITITPSAAFATTGAVNGVLEIEPLGIVGTVVVGNASAAQSGTSNDVRGTYSPATTPDGAIGYSLLVSLVDPAYRGEAQYAG